MTRLATAQSSTSTGLTRVAVRANTDATGPIKHVSRSCEWIACVSNTPPSSVTQSPTPRRLVILGSALPGRLDGRQIGGSGNSHIDEALGLQHPVAEAVLEYRHHPSGSLRFGRDDAIDIRQRPGHRLLAENLLTRCQGSQSLLDVQCRRRADVDDVDVVHAQQVIKGPRAAPNGEFIGDCGKSPFVDIAQNDYPKLVGMPFVSFNMSAADAATDDGDGPYPADCVRHSC